LNNQRGGNMSWDYEESTKPCPCGEGLNKVIDGSYYCGQTGHYKTILCPEFRKKYLTKVAFYIIRSKG